MSDSDYRGIARAADNAARAARAAELVADAIDAVGKNPMKSGIDAVGIRGNKPSRELTPEEKLMNEKSLADFSRWAK